MSTTVNAQDVQDAELFVTEYLTGAIPDGDYSDGAALRDLAVKAVAGVVALLRQTGSQIEVRQSLKTILEVDTSDDPTATDDAVDAWASNWFLSRKTGGYARVVAYGLTTQRADFTVPRTTRFYKTGDLVFLLDNRNQDLPIAAEQLAAIFDSSGIVIGYQFKIPLVARDTGTAGNIDPGRFAAFDHFSPYVTQIETQTKAIGGKDVEATTDLINRSQNAVSTRNLINARSCDAVLRDEFPALTTVSVIGMGDREMIRDREVEATNGIEVHTGGCQDVFIATDVIETAFTGTIGGQFIRPDNLACVFRDPTYAPYDFVNNPTGHKFTDPDPTPPHRTIQAGMVLRIWSGLPIGARDYVIHDVQAAQLLVSERTPFPVATDELSGGTGTVRWSVGHYMPDYQDVVPQQTTGQTSRRWQTSGRVTLPGGPVYRITDVAILDATDSDADPTDGMVHLNVRVNDTPTTQVAPDNQYQLIVHNPGTYQSQRSFAEIVVGVVDRPEKYDGKSVKVTYETLASFDTVDYRVANPFDKISAASPLARAYHPLYLKFVVEYSRLRSATDTVDAEAAAQALAAFINTFPATEIIDMSTISDQLRAHYPSIVGQVYPFTIEYEVYVPDGRVITFTTADKVELPADTVRLRALQAAPDDPIEGLLDPLEYGLSDAVVCYRAATTDIVVRERT
jgi:hypothetical protein